MIDTHELKKRDLYLNKIIAFQDTEPVKVVTGIRRCGKSSLLMLMTLHLKETGITDDQILEMNFESYAYKNMTSDSFYEYVKQHIVPNKRMYFFFDEVQRVPDWEDAVIEELETKLNAENIEKGKSFLEENAKRPGVVTLPSGLQYEVITEGNGKKPSATDRVKCHYEGTLIDGTLFDSSIKRGEPAIFGVNQVIKGWVEALQLMTEGAKWKLFIPSELAYGAQQAGEMIPPHSTLIFEVELIEVL